MDPCGQSGAKVHTVLIAFILGELPALNLIKHFNCTSKLIYIDILCCILYDFFALSYNLHFSRYCCQASVE
jgi:hypothetical protein